MKASIVYRLGGVAAWAVVAAAAVSARGAAGAAGWEGIPARRDENQAWADARTATWRATYGDTNTHRVFPGVLADRAAGAVTVLAEATGIAGRAVAEFYVITRGSGNGYEALMAALADAADIHRALTYIGMNPGRPVQRSRLVFWPRGERVCMTVRSADRADDPWRSVEALMMDAETGATAPTRGLVFVGGPTRTAPDGTFEHAVDTDSRGAIAANYNEPITVFDVPRAAPQSAVYETQWVAEDIGFEAGERLEWRLVPERAPERPRVIDLVLKIDRIDDAPTFRFEGVDPATPKAVADAAGMLAALRALVEAGRDPFVTVDVGPAARLVDVAAIATLLAMIEGDDGIRVEPPPDGQLYYRALLPPEEYLDRERRIMQPLELSLFPDEQGTAARVIDINEVWREREVLPKLTFTERHAADPAALAAMLAAEDPDVPVLLVFAPGRMTHGELLRWIGPPRAVFPTVHVFIDRRPPPLR